MSSRSPSQKDESAQISPPQRENCGSPIGPGFVVYERADGGLGYDLAMAKASVGPGWHPLLESLWRALDVWKESEASGAFIIQVKEKWGILSIYHVGGTDTLFGYILGLQSASASVCEDCGNRGRLRDHLGWWRTLCDGCLAAWEEVRR